MAQKLPLFPLNMVLFPGAPLPLHIFEERYRLMVSRCLEQQHPFGVVMITQGRAEETDVTFSPVGTTAQISEYVRLDDGRYYLVAIGQRRFRIQYLTQRLPYYVASVTMLSEETGGSPAEAANQLRTLYQRYWTAISGATGVQLEHEALPDDLIDLTYWMANRFQVDYAQKQRWLEADVSTRLREMIAALRAELALLPNAGPPGPRDTGWSGTNSLN